jgi:hypothetical protein
MSDRFELHEQGLESPAASVFQITPNDTADLAHVTRGLNVAQSGFVHVTLKGGQSGIVFVAAGGVFPVRATRVHATGTTATGLVGLF